MDSIITKLLDKSIEAFSMAIELYNKPTIKYRVEGFCMFICNAWELMLKAHIMNSLPSKSIYYKNNKKRTISLDKCIEVVFTNNKDPLRLNLEKIQELRNTSTHFITEEYEMVYVPLFQACVFNYNEKMLEFHNVDMTSVIPQNFLTLAVSMSALNEETIIAKYPEEIAQKLITTAQSVSSQEQISNNHSFSIAIEHYHYITKDKNKATSILNIDNTANTSVKIIREVKNPNNTHNYTVKGCNNEINKRLSRAGVVMKYNNTPAAFNKFHFQLFCQYYNIKQNEKYCFVNTINATPTYSYSIHVIEFIVNEIKNDPDYIISALQNKLKLSQSKKLTSGAKEF